MASPSEAEVKTQWINRVRILEQFRKFLGTHTAAGGTSDVGANFIAMEDTDSQAQESDFVAESTSALSVFRSYLATAIVQSPNMIMPFLRAYGKVLNVPETDAQSLITRIYDDYADNAKRVTSRQFTFGSPAAGGGNSGTGVINRLNKDDRNFDIEAQTADAKTALCISDAHSGSVQHEELFEVRGQTAGKDLIAISGSGKSSVIKAISARDSLVSNPSFSSFSGTLAAPTAITDWTVTTNIANFQLDQTNTYRGFFGDTTPTAVRFETNDTLTQSFDVRALQLSPYVPIYVQLAYNREVYAGDGTLTLTFGNVSANVVFAAQAGWNILRIAIGQNNWLRQFNKQSPTVSIALSGNTTGDVLVDDLIIAPYTPFDGSWYAIVGGATPFLKNDSFTWSDTEVGAILQHWMWRSFGRYFPHATGGAVTFAEPAN